MQLIYYRTYRDHLIANILYKYVGHNTYTDFTWYKKEYNIDFCVT